MAHYFWATWLSRKTRSKAVAENNILVARKRGFPKMVLGVNGRFHRRSTGPKDHINIRTSHSGSKAQHKEDIRNNGLQDPLCLSVVMGP